MPQTRQPAAIMVTGIVRYIASMGYEQNAFELLNKNRQIQKPLTVRYGGKWILWQYSCFQTFLHKLDFPQL